MGMTGKAAISPRHVNTINKVFSATQEEIDYAIRVCEGCYRCQRKGLGAWSLDRMIDAPVIKRAVAVLAGTGDMKEEYNDLL